MTMTAIIPTPLAEAADRYTIAVLKKERLLEQVAYYAPALIEAEHPGLTKLVGELYQINSQIWDAEAAIRAGQDQELGLEEIGRRALKIRDLNRVRVGIKNQIVELTGEGFLDCKMNSTTYAKGTDD
jgi:hypothetical protein